MNDGVKKLEQDVAIVVAMAAQMDDYLKSNVLFGKMGRSGMPMLTLGGYLMRQYRLLALSDLLSQAKQAETETAVSQFNAALVEKIVRFETKAHTELDARIRQFEAYLHDLRHRQATGVNYRTAVELRAMIAAIINQLMMAPYQLERKIPSRVEILDQTLRQHWVPDTFIWPEAWQPAYPQDEFWWLYGEPKA
ncbi:MAG: hypothetical protein CSA11_02735 [Chloroflexi bacterium]|nr:MAG: hypothetical protein CSA11_02735 [Chloroflexota bacterium]